MWTRLRLRCAALVGRARFERELADELAFHVQARAEEWERRVLLVGAPVLLVAAALLACAVPAWRAVRIDPASTLRAE